MIDQQPYQAHRFVAQVFPDHVRGGTVIARAEQQIEGALDGRKAHLEVLRSQLKEPLRLRQRLLATRQTFLDRRDRREERAGNLVNSEAAEEVQRERDLRIFVEA